MQIPKGTTHVWTPAYEHPYIGNIFRIFRRCFYKRHKNVWYSYTIDGAWQVSGNTPEWFATEKAEGYFVTIKRFKDPKFVIKEEYLHE